MELVLPHVAEAYIHISREKPDDAIQYMVDFLQQKGRSLEEGARASKQTEFYGAYEEAQRRERLLFQGAEQFSSDMLPQQ